MADLKRMGKQILARATDFSGSPQRKVGKGILAFIIVALLGLLGLEAANVDYITPLIGEETLYDKAGNVTTDKTVGKKAGDYNCEDFTTQVEAQSFLAKAGGGSNDDFYRLDGDDDGEACEELPKAN